MYARRIRVVLTEITSHQAGQESMSNLAYLAASDKDTIYPSFAQKDYDPDEQLIASDVECLPLLWLALFREADLQHKDFKVDGEAVSAFAPICEKQQALVQLEQAIPYLEKIFPDLGPLRKYGEMFRSAIEPLPYRYISLELEEIDGLYPEEHRFKELLTLGLRGFDVPDGIQFECDDVTVDLSGINLSFESADDDIDEDLMEELRELNSGNGEDEGGTFTIPGFTASSHAEVLTRLASLNDDISLPSVRMYLDDLEATEDERWNFTRVLGAGRFGSMGYGREVPWEKEDADFGWEMDTDFDDED